MKKVNSRMGAMIAMLSSILSEGLHGTGFGNPSISSAGFMGTRRGKKPGARKITDQERKAKRRQANKSRATNYAHAKLR